HRIEEHVRRHDLIEPAGDVLCLVSGGADSTCLFHALRELGYRVSALHVDHGLRGEASDADARWCAERFGAEIVDAAPRCSSQGGLPPLAQPHPSARENTVRAVDERGTMPPALAELLDSPAGSKRVDLGGGMQAVREHDRLWLEHGPQDLSGSVDWGPWRIES